MVLSSEKPKASDANRENDARRRPLGRCHGSSADPGAFVNPYLGNAAAFVGQMVNCILGGAWLSAQVASDGALRELYMAGYWVP